MEQVLQTTWSKKAISTVDWKVLRAGSAEITRLVKAAEVGQNSELYSKGGKKQWEKWYQYPKCIRASEEQRDDIVDFVAAVNAGYRYKGDEVYTSEIGDTFAEATLGKDGEETGEAEERAALGDQQGFKSE